MLTPSKTPPKRRKNEAEKPFWISFADLMTALMVLFLVAMAVALLSVTEGLRQQDDLRVQRDKGISSCLQDIAQMTQEKSLAGVQLRGQTLELGTLAEFPKDSHQLDAQRADFLRDFIPKVLDVARTPACQMWLKRFVLEGYASPEGSYLYNLNLSLARSQRVLCVLLDDASAKAPRQSDRQAVRDMFFVGGSSFNSAILNQPEKSRRVELRLEFKELDPSCSSSGACEALPVKPIPWDDDVKCPLATR
ncbi:flagellar motor protein MotB [Limnohabitans sp.]|uniref:flagellar motor protein MotB n=1 Tax=Limnohabitans sp. TaxID=1907725 RepID=UPI00333EEB31